MRVEAGTAVKISNETLRMSLTCTSLNEDRVDALVRCLLDENVVAMTVQRTDPVTGDDLDVPVEVEVSIIPGSRGSRDSLGGRRGAGPALEPDEPTTAEVVDVQVMDDDLAPKFPNFELTDDEQNSAVELALERY